MTRPATRPTAARPLARAVQVIAAIALAMAAAVVSLLPERTTTLLVGRPGDDRRLSGMSLPDQHLGRRGRWTRGDGVLTFPDVAVPAEVVLQVSAPQERVPDAIEISAEGGSVRRTILAAGWNAVSIAMGPPHVPTATRDSTPDGARASTRRVRIRSLTSGTAAAPLGVFVERADLVMGGMRRLAATPPVTWFGVVLAFLGVIAFATYAAPPGTRWAATLALLALAIVGTSAFLPAIAAHVLGLVIACWSLAALAWVSTTTPARTIVAWPAWRLAAVATLSFVAIVALLLPDVFLRGEVLSQADMLFEFYPWRSVAPGWYRSVDRPPLGDVPMMVYPFAVFTQSRFAAWSVPLWTNAIGSGQPFLGTFQSALLSPFTWLLAFVSLPQAVNVIAVGRLLVGGLGMFLFIRAIGLSRWTAAFAGTAFLLNPFAVVWLEHPLAGVTPWLPWMLLVADRLSRERASLMVTAACLATVTAMVLAGGHPHTGAFTAMLGGSYAVAAAASSSRRTRALPVALASLVLGTLLVAVQVLPFLEYLSLSRGLTLRQGYALNPFFAPASTLVTTLVPNFLGHHGSANYAGPLNYLEQQTYPGLAIWLLACVGLASAGRRWRVWFFATTALLAFLVIYAAPGIHQLVSALPLLKSASLTRFPGVALASLTIVAAFGLERVLDHHADGERQSTAGREASRTLSLVMLAAAAAVGLLVAFALRANSTLLSQKALWDFTLRWSAFAFWMAAAVTVLVVARLHGRLLRAPAAIGLTAVLVLDLLLFGYGFHDTMPADQVFPVVPEVAAAQQDRDVFRVLGIGQALLPDAAMAYGLQDIRSYDGLGVARYADLLDTITSGDPFLTLAPSITSPLIDLLNVKYVFALPDKRPPEGWFVRVTDGEAPLYRNTRVFPRAFLVDGYVVRDGNDARRTLRDGLVDFHRVALLERDPPAARRPAAAANPDEVGSAQLVHYEDGRVAIRTDSTGHRLLVLTDVHYPGWQVSVDGVRAPLYRANFAFRAVPVPAGRHDVVFEFRSRAVRVGLAISGVSACIVAGLLIASLRHRKGA